MTTTANPWLNDLGDAPDLTIDVDDGDPRYRLDSLTPTAVARPATAAALAAALGVADRHQLKVAPIGGGTKTDLGFPPDGYDLALSTTGLDRLIEYEPADLTITVEAGMTLARLTDILDTNGQFTPLESPLPTRATVGGALATNASGPMRSSYGSARDILLGIRYARPQGDLARAGARVVKNVAGYELTKLFIGALGTLGVLTEVSLKVFPKLRQPTTMLIALPDARGATEFVRAARQTRIEPLALDLLNGHAQGRLGVAQPSPWLLAVGLAGVPATIDRWRNHINRIGHQLGGVAGDELAASDHSAWWRAVSDVGWTDPAPIARLKVSVPEASTGHVAAMLAELTPDADLIARPGLGLIWLFWRHDTNPADIVSVVGHCRRLAASHQGWCVVDRCPVEAKALLDIWGAPTADLPLMRRIRDQFDPRRTLNAGRYVGRI